MINVKHLGFAYSRDLPILEDISFEVEKGQFIGIFGPNGGGKTTLLKLLLGLLKPTTGDIKLGSSKVGYVPQMRRYDKQFPITVIDVVLQGCLSLGRGWGGYPAQAKIQAAEALEMVGLAEKANAPFGALSGGQTQRALLARALASKPDILFLDEATVGVDPEGLRDIFELLIGFKGELTTFLVTHDLQVIAKEMDQLFCIQRTLTQYTANQVCEHFALGLYHPPLFRKEEDK